MDIEAHRVVRAFGGKLTHPVEVQLTDCGWLRVEAWNHARMASPFWRFYWNGNRGASVVLDGHTTHLLPSRYVLIPPHTPFVARLSRPVWHFCLHFVTASGRIQLAPGIYAFPVSEALGNLLADIRIRLRRETPQLSLRTSLLCQTLVHEALCRLPDSQLTFERTDERMDRVMRMMESQLSEPLAIAELARRTGMHVNTFTRLFKRATGHAPQGYYNRLRLQRAVLLLLSTHHTIDDIAEQTGFCDRFHFSRAFARQYGSGPADFRRHASHPASG